jgi:hypothetical protein
MQPNNSQGENPMSEATANPVDFAAYTEAMAAALGLTIPEEIKPGVVANVAHIFAIAQPLLSFPLPDTVESAATFEP